jgi:hypothetical protein
MFIIPMPKTFKVGDTADVRINGRPERVTWRDAKTLVIEPDDARYILAVNPGPGDLDTFCCCDPDGTGAIGVGRAERQMVMSPDGSWSGAEFHAAEADLRARGLPHTFTAVMHELARRDRAARGSE